MCRRSTLAPPGGACGLGEICTARGGSANEPGPAALAEQRRDQRTLAYRPTISILTPVCNPGPAALRDAIASVLAQTYDRWELCLADGASDAPGVAAMLAGAAVSDARIRVRRLPRNLGASGNLNAALGMATGEFVLPLDQDGLLAPDLLYAVARGSATTAASTPCTTTRTRWPKTAERAVTPGSSRASGRLPSCYPPTCWRTR